MPNRYRRRRVGSVGDGSPRRRSGCFLALGWALQLGDAVDPHRSAEAFSTALEFDPGDPWVHKGLANACYLIGDERGAIVEYEWVEKHVVTISTRCRPPRPARRRVVRPHAVQLGLGDDDQARHTYEMIREELGDPVRDKHRGRCTVGMDRPMARTLLGELTTVTAALVHSP